jgi:hypothetical protein
MEIKELRLTEREFETLEAIVSQLREYVNATPDYQGVVNMHCGLYEREIENLIAIHCKLKWIE